MMRKMTLSLGQSSILYLFVFGVAYGFFLCIYILRMCSLVCTSVVVLNMAGGWLCHMRGCNCVGGVSNAN